ncbi:MAG TPA: YihA family ribosome biogenesis GTP-binding protein [Fibrobacter sp.]|nr:YihA family ribosome biogenesis GTP-binding protein [Fibrobacter sp.]
MVGGVQILSVEFVKGAVEVKDLPEERLPQVAFLGRSNVGKSTLLNALMGEKNLVKTSGTPGKTREINFFRVNESFFLVDLPGVGYAKVSIKQRNVMAETIRNYIEKAEDLCGVVYLVDIRHAGTAIDVLTVEELRNTGVPVLVVASKGDKVNQTELRQNKKQIKEKFALSENPIVVSSLRQTGFDELWIEILNALRKSNET